MSSAILGGPRPLHDAGAIPRDDRRTRMAARPPVVEAVRPSLPTTAHEDGQAIVLLLAVLCAVVVGAVAIGMVGASLGLFGERRRAADLAALSAARAMHDVYDRLFEPPFIGLARNPRHLERSAYLTLARRTAQQTARRNGAKQVAVAFPDGDQAAPIRVTVTVKDPIRVVGHDIAASISATAELVPVAADIDDAAPAGAGAYAGRLAQRQGKRMRPDVAMAFDRLAAAARRDGHALVITSAFRTDVEQARLFAANPDPKLVARPGTSLHRLGTELDLGPASAYPWLAREARRFGFVQRYSYEPWHYGYAGNASSVRVGYRYGSGDGRRSAGVPDFVPPRFAKPLAEAAQRWNVSAALLAAQLHAESGFNPFAVSPAGARGIAQFMPGTAVAYGLRNPFDPRESIDAQGHLMHDLLRRFGSVPLALAAYNAGPAPVQRCGCIPPFAETRRYVARILGLLGGIGESPSDGALTVRLVA